MQRRHVKAAVLSVLLACSIPLVSAQSLAQPAPPPAPVVPIVPPTPVVIQAPPPQAQPNLGDLPTSILAWDSTDKAVAVDFGTLNAAYSFSFTNVSAEPVSIQSVRTSCGCTTAQLPPMPWLIPPGSNEVLNVNMNLAGKSGTVIKSVTVVTDKGIKNLLVRTTILPMTSAAGMADGAREQNQMLALADRQAVFKGDCATCHTEPAKGKLGSELYTAACGVCHEAEHRATMVPDLKVAKQERNAEYWRNWITNGKQGTLMPAFAMNQGGILTDEQISSLVDHLMKAMPTQPVPGAGANVSPPVAH
jgi:mono/diheme cytochrome c family protein